MPRYQMHLACNDCKNLQSTEILRATVHADGTVEGLTGSASEFCDACDSTSLTVLGASAMAV